jgi:aminopeptidase C
MQKRIVQLKAEQLGLPPEWFTHLAIDKDDNDHTITLIFVKVSEEHKGYFRALVKAVEATGYKPLIYQPIARTQGIISRMGYAPMNEAVWSKGGS